MSSAAYPLLFTITFALKFICSQDVRALTSKTPLFINTLPLPDENKIIHTSESESHGENDFVVPMQNSINSFETSVDNPITSAVQANSDASLKWIDEVDRTIATIHTVLENFGIKVEKKATGRTIGEAGSECLERLLAERATGIIQQESRVLSGGHIAFRALIRLHTLASEPYGLHMMKKLGLPVILSSLMRRESTPDVMRGLAMSLSARISQLPTVVQITDGSTGSYYHMDV